MTADEFKVRLSAMSADEKKEFKLRIGAPGNLADHTLIEMFIKDPAWEKKICHRLGPPTDADKVGTANFPSALNSRWALVVSLISLAIAIGSLAVAIIALRG
jgi:hypothetical protein